MKPLTAMLGLMALMGCMQDVPQAAASGGKVQSFKLTATSAFGVQTVPSGEITARAAEVCPKGYTSLDRGPQVTRRLSGVFYTDVTVRVTCAV